MYIIGIPPPVGIPGLPGGQEFRKFLDRSESVSALPWVIGLKAAPLPGISMPSPESMYSGTQIQGDVAPGDCQKCLSSLPRQLKSSQLT